MHKLINITLAFLIVTCNINAQHSNLSIIIGTGGGDGIAISNIYGMEYGYQSTPTIELYGKYNQSHASHQVGMPNTEMVLPINTAATPDTELLQYQSIGAGAHFHLNRTENAALVLTTGGRYASSHRTNVLSTRNGVIELVELQQNSSLGFEFGLGYRRLIMEKFVLGARATYLSFETRYSAELQLGIKF